MRAEPGTDPWLTCSAMDKHTTGKINPLALQLLTMRHKEDLFSREVKRIPLKPSE
jgi:hypothetical protein